MPVIEGFERPPDLVLKQRLKNLIWDGQRGTCCTRTPLNWLSISIYYSCFVAVLAGLFILTLYSVTWFHNDQILGPRMKLKLSPIGVSPGIHVFPKMLSRPVVRFFKIGDLRNLQIIDQINKIIQQKGYNLSNLGLCSKPPYGYDIFENPCVFISFNNVIGWQPEPYKPYTPFPNDITKSYKFSPTSNNSDVYVYCHGKNPFDREKIPASNFRFIPSPLFRSNYITATNMTDVNPVIALRLKTKEKNVIITIVCKAWNSVMNEKVAVTEFIVYAD